jgi:hypothetical protein
MIRRSSGWGSVVVSSPSLDRVAAAECQKFTPHPTNWPLRLTNRQGQGEAYSVTSKEVHHRAVRDALGVLLVTVGLTLTLLTGDKVGLVIAFGGVTLLAYGVLRSPLPGPSDGKEPPIF